MSVDYKQIKPRIIKALYKDLETFTLAELRDYAKSFDLPIGGNKHDVIMRLLSFSKATICATLGD